jgi:hypothetical protein
VGAKTLVALLIAITVTASAGGSPSAAADPGTVDVCGPISFYSPATATTNNQLGIGGVTYQLVLSGTVPPELGARSTALSPEVVRLTGRLVQGVNTVADYTVVRVASCPSLPNTSTLAASEDTNAVEVWGTLPAPGTSDVPSPLLAQVFAALAVAAFLSAYLVRQRRLSRRSQSGSQEGVNVA